jgi:hypothetical protein
MGASGRHARSQSEARARTHARADDDQNATTKHHQKAMGEEGYLLDKGNATRLCVELVPVCRLKRGHRPPLLVLVFAGAAGWVFVSFSSLRETECSI